MLPDNLRRRIDELKREEEDMWPEYGFDEYE